MCCDEKQSGKAVILVNSDQIGADPELGALLMSAFLNTLPQITDKPGKIIFLNTGVNLTTHGSPVLDALGELAQSGVEILSCGTCLDFLEKKDRLKVGKITNMYDTAETLTGPLKVVSLG